LVMLTPRWTRGYEEEEDQRGLGFGIGLTKTRFAASGGSDDAVRGPGTIVILHLQPIRNEPKLR
jgi:hypothetical protein